MTVTDINPGVSRWPGLSQGALRTARIAMGVCVFVFFTGLDRTLFDGYLAPRLGVDWLRQAYNVLVMLSFCLFGLTVVRGVILPIVLNLCLIPFNTINAFVTRVGFAFWCGCASDAPSLTFINRSAALGTIVGTLAVIADGLYVTFIHMTKTYGAGFFIIPNFVVGAVLGIPFLTQTRYPMSWATLVFLASIFSGSDSVILLCLVAVAFTFRKEAIRITMAATLAAIVFALAFRTPLNYAYKTPHRVAVTYNLTKDVVRALVTARGSTVRVNNKRDIDTKATRAAHEMVLQDRTFGFNVIHTERWRLLAPLSDVRANDVGHIGAELYAATYGVILLVLYLACAYMVLPRPIFVFFCLLLPLYTDPLFDFGVGFLALRSAPLCLAERQRISAADRGTASEVERSYGGAIITS